MSYYTIATGLDIDAGTATLPLLELTNSTATWNITQTPDGRLAVGTYVDTSVLFDGNGNIQFPGMTTSPTTSYGTYLTMGASPLQTDSYSIEWPAATPSLGQSVPYFGTSGAGTWLLATTTASPNALVQRDSFGGVYLPTVTIGSVSITTATISALFATTATITALHASTVTLSLLNVGTETVSMLIGTTATVSYLFATTATINNLISSSGLFTTLTAGFAAVTSTASIAYLLAATASIPYLTGVTMTASLQSLNLVSGNSSIDETTNGITISTTGVNATITISAPSGLVVITAATVSIPNIVVSTVSISNLIAGTATFTLLSVTGTATINTLIASSATIGYLTVTASASIANLFANTATINNLYASTATITNLIVTNTIPSLIISTLTVSSIQSANTILLGSKVGFLSASKVVANGIGTNEVLRLFPAVTGLYLLEFDIFAYCPGTSPTINDYRASLYVFYNSTIPSPAIIYEFDKGLTTGQFVTNSGATATFFTVSINRDASVSKYLTVDARLVYAQQDTNNSSSLTLTLAV